MPAGFWNNFPNNVLPPDSPWQAVAPHKVIPQVNWTRGSVVGFNWPVPDTSAEHTCLLVITSAANDPIQTNELVISTLVQGNKKVGLKNLTVINPPAIRSARRRVIPLNIWDILGKGESRYRLALDPGGITMVQGVIFSKKHAEYALKAKMKKLALDEEAQAAVNNALKLNPTLREKLDVANCYAVSRRDGLLLQDAVLPKDQPEPILVILNPTQVAGSGSIVQFDAKNRVVGGFTFQAI